jgi:hypothetical protein
MAKARYRYNIMLRPEPEGGYTALVPALPGCVTYGRPLWTWNTHGRIKRTLWKDSR